MSYIKSRFVNILILLLIFSSTLWAQENLNKIEILSQNSKELLLQFSLQDLQIKNKTINSEKFQYLEASNLKLDYKKGAPDILRYTFSIAIPNTEWWNNIEILSSDFTEYKNINLLPSRGVIYRDQDSKNIPYQKGKEYNKNYFYPVNLVSTGKPFIFRDYRGESVSLYPIQYNPVSKTLRVYHSIKIKLSSKGEKGINPLVKRRNIISKEFSHLYKKLFVNYQTSRYAIVEESGEMLIIAPDAYVNDILVFANWKRQSGIPTKVVALSKTGSSASEIKNYIKQYYTFNNLAYVVLVGDYDTLPNLYSHGDSDPSYAQIDGTDHYPDIIVGRFSAADVGQLYTIMGKSIWYEKDIQTDADWLNKAMGISDNANTLGDDGETDVQHMDKIKNKLLNYNYATVDSAYDKYSITATKIGEYLNEGRGLINYVGHGATDKWVTSSFGNQHIDTLHNINKLPFIFDVACVNGDFKGKTCFAEKWLRAQEGGAYTGAVAIIASTVNQPWDPPMDGQDEMIDILTESYENNIKRTFGGIAYNGVMHMLDQYPEDADGPLTADTWTIFGDPSLHVRTKAPQIVNITHNDSIVIGDNHFIVYADKEDVLVSLSKINGDTIQLLNSGLINDGSVSIAIPAFEKEDTMLVTVTGYNKLTVIDTVWVIKPNGPFVIFDSFDIDDSTENNNAKADFKEKLYLNLKLKNIGIATAKNITVNVTSTSSYINIINSAFSCDSLEIDKDSVFTKKVQIQLSDNVPDQKELFCNVKIQYDTDITYNALLNIICNAPKFSLELKNIDDSLGGNNNGRLDTSETVHLILKAKNIGHSKADSVFLKAQSSSYFVFSLDSVYSDSLLKNEEQLFSLTGTVTDEVPDKSFINFDFVLQSGEYSTNLIKRLPINICVEDWEGKLTVDTFNWEFTGNLPWKVTADEVFEGDSSIVSGKITNNQKSILSIKIIVLNDDTISFYKKVSCESSPYSTYGSWYDYFQFDIDGVQKGKWDGEIDWSKEKYFITKGEHTFAWKYVKDDTDFSGKDCAWLDYIVFPHSKSVETVTYYQSLVVNKDWAIYPNPVKNILNIEYALKNSSQVKIGIYSITGKLLQYILSDYQEAGTYTIQNRNIQLSKGIYFVKLSTETSSRIKKFVVE